jgi:hypothetical protein
MNERNQKNKKDDSMEENINTMINDLLKEDEMDKISINDSTVLEKELTNKNVSAPTICINTVPFSENSTRRMPILLKTLSSQENKKSNILSTNFANPLLNRNMKKRHSLETQLSYNFKEFIPSPKSSNLQANFNYQNSQVNKNFETNFYKNENVNQTMLNNSLSTINTIGNK